MPRFFLDSNNISAGIAVITGADAIHVGRSLRMRVGDEITLVCEKKDYFCNIVQISDVAVQCAVLREEENRSEAGISLTLFQALPKLDKLESILQKAVELGAVRVVPVLSDRCVSRPNSKDFSKRLERLEKISLEAAKQSGRGIVPEVGALCSFKAAATVAKAFDKAFICYENGGERLEAALIGGAKTIAVFVGSEGGFEQSEVDFAVENGIVPIWMGERILRCETAPSAVISIIMNLTGNM